MSAIIKIIAVTLVLLALPLSIKAEQMDTVLTGFSERCDSTFGFTRIADDGRMYYDTTITCDTTWHYKIVPITDTVTPSMVLWPTSDSTIGWVEDTLVPAFIDPLIYQARSLDTIPTGEWVLTCDTVYETMGVTMIDDMIWDDIDTQIVCDSIAVYQIRVKEEL